MEKTFVMIKPDGVRRKLVGEIIKRIEDKGLELEDIKIIQLSKEQAEQHYSIHKNQEFFNDLIKYITSDPVVIIVVKGRNAVQAVRQLIGVTDPIKALPGTIRGDFGFSIQENIIHGSDSKENAENEIKFFFE